MKHFLMSSCHTWDTGPCEIMSWVLVHRVVPNASSLTSPFGAARYASLEWQWLPKFDI